MSDKELHTTPVPIDYFLCLAAGLLGTPHCIGMCGVVVTVYSLGCASCGDHGSLAANGWRRACAIGHLAYTAGRIATYSILGGFMGLLGSFVDGAGRLGGLPGAAAIGAGLLILLMGLGRPLPAWLERWSPLRIAGLRHRVGDWTRRPTPGRLFCTGLLMGFLPCGLSYTMQIKAAATGAPVFGMLTMLVFGLGTVPGLTAVGTLAASAGGSVRRQVQHASAALAIAMGTFRSCAGWRRSGGSPRSTRGSGEAASGARSPRRHEREGRLRHLGAVYRCTRGVPDGQAKRRFLQDAGGIRLDRQGYGRPRAIHHRLQGSHLRRFVFAWESLPRRTIPEEGKGG